MKEAKEAAIAKAAELKIKEAEKAAQKEKIAAAKKKADEA